MADNRQLPLANPVVVNKELARLISSTHNRYRRCSINKESCSVLVVRYICLVKSFPIVCQSLTGDITDIVHYKSVNQRPRLYVRSL